ncbi:S8 family serine peptidase [Kordiimonas lacus]|uniref:Hemolysin-type calcium-binding repeat-containing protein n=1 Tax=Kordiimonas lacus TaxID=637679 RepID=A0A1G6WYK1_9PROT|nr:S8 family serine peptidase [Kordiimonas lacus]SDD70277.1 Hemolysin-type calcium-binding repeat-containing protein [Kordiimonas lacus]
MGNTGTDKAAPQTADDTGDGYTIPFGDFAGTYVPFNDPLFPFQANLTGFMYDDTGAYTESAHINILPVWDEYDGTGILIASVEEIDFRHPDLEGAQVDNAPVSYEEMFQNIQHDYTHGTSTAGIIGARAGNGIGLAGVAHGSSILAGYSIYNGVTAELNADVDIVTRSVSGGFLLSSDLNGGYSGATDFLAEGRDGLGIVWVNGSGNWRYNDSTTDISWGLNELYVLSVGAASPNGFVTVFSVAGSALHMVSPLAQAFLGAKSDTTLSLDRPGNWGEIKILGAEITEFEITGQAPQEPGFYLQVVENSLAHAALEAGFEDGDYIFYGGTSSSGPLVSGATALVLEAASNNVFGDTELGWRDVQEIFALSSAHTGSGFGITERDLYDHELNSWIINGASILNGGGLHWSADYGFGMLDVHAAVRLAETWTMTRHSGNLVEQSHSFATASETITYGADLTFKFVAGDADAIDIDGVELQFDIVHDAWPELEMILISPSGTEIILFDTPELTASAPHESANTGQLEWDLLARGFWGEESAGEWTLVIRDTVDNGNSGTVNSLSLMFLGDAATDDDIYYFTDDWALMNAANGGVPVLDDALGQNSINAAALMEAILLKLAPGSTSKIGGETAFKTSADAVFTLGIGTDQDDTLVGAAFDETLYGMQGDDRMWAGAGDVGADSYYGGDGADIIGVGAGNDLAVGEAGNDAIFGGAGDDTLVGGFWEGGSASAVGGGHNELWAGSGDDVIHGANGNDALGGGTESDTIYGYGGHDILYAGKGAVSDTLDGGAGQDTLFGGGGDDMLSGGGGNDLIFNGAGSDTATGGDGDDTLWGGGGDDLLTGGTGADIFAFTSTNGSDTVTDFDAAEDILLLDGSGFADLAALKAATTEDGAGVTISFGDTVIILSGISLDDLTAANVML